VADLKQDGTYNLQSDHLHKGSESDAESGRSTCSVLRHAGSSVKNFFVGKLHTKSPSPNPDPDLQPDWEIEEVNCLAASLRRVF
jgi:hypothetical protein